MPPCLFSAGIIDLSHYDSPSAHAAVGEGFTFFTHKAGGDANDAEMAAWWDDMKAYRGRVLLGAYWVLYPGAATSRADAFLARLDATCDGWRNGPFILQVDCEKWNGDSSTVPSKSDIKTFCDRLKAKMPKLTPIVYAPQWVYGNTLNGLGYPLWASSYVNGVGTASGLYPRDDSSKWNAYSGQTPAVLQFTSSATIAGQTTCDANAYRGTLAQLTNLLAPGWAPPPAPVEESDVEFGDKVPGAAYSQRDYGDFVNDTWGVRDILRGDATGAAAAGYPAGAPLLKLLAVPGRLDALEASIASLLARPAADIDVDALATALEPKINGMTRDEVKAALVEVLQEGTGGTA